MCWESSGVDGFDLSPHIQGQTSIAKPKRASSTLQLKRHSQLIQNLFTGTDCIPGRKSGILRIQYGHAAAAEISFWTR